MRKNPLSISQRVGMAIRLRRRAHKVSQEKFSSYLDVHRTYYSKVEQGKKNIRIDTLERIAAALNTSSWEILKDAEGWRDPRDTADLPDEATKPVRSVWFWEPL